MRLVVAVAVTISLGISAAYAEEGFTTEKTSLRKGPGGSFPLVATIPKFDDVDMRSCASGWCKVRWKGKSGYAKSAHLITYDEACLFDDDDLFC